MNRYGLQILITIGLLIVFIIDKALQGVFSIFDYISLSVVILVILANLKLKDTFIVPFFLLGVISDWYNKTYLGAGSVVVLFSLYVFYIFRIRFINNKAAMTVLNLFFVWILLFMINGFDNVLNLNYVIGAVVTTLAISPVWLKE